MSCDNMSLLALRPVDTNVVSHAGDGVKPEPPSDAEECASRRYPDWLLEHRQQRCFTLKDFHVAQQLGSGKFGLAARAKERATGKVVVLKAIKKEDIIAEGFYRQFQREVETHCRLSHPHIIRLYAYFHDDVNCYMVLEIAGGGNLYTRLYQQQGKRLDERSAAVYVRQLCSALAYLHKRSVIHRDIKPENLLLCIDKNGKESLKLADFGWCVAQRSNSQRTTFCGTPEYLPPELCKEQKDEYSSPFDMYDVGVLTYEMLVGRPPFQHDAADQHFHVLMSRIAKGRVVIPPSLSPEAAALVRALMSLDPADRPTAQEVLKHPWVVMHAGATEDAEWDV